MANPYHGRPAHSYWREAVASLPWDRIDPVVEVPFTISRSDRVATAGSCFAQHLSQMLKRSGFVYLVTEIFAGHAGTVDENYGVFPARFGNVYTPRQLLQLFDRAYGLFRPQDRALRTPDGGFVDPFRPRIQSGGFSTVELLEADRLRHFAAVRQMFETCDVFIFTLGLTEHWASPVDGAVFPLAPGVVSDELDPDDYSFGNFTVGEIVADLEDVLGKLRRVNRNVRIMLTVSPVSLIATYEDRHVLVSTVASKSALRAAADEICRIDPAIAYFPSYEIITGPQAGGRLYSEGLRDVSPDGVRHVMALFQHHFLAEGKHLAAEEHLAVEVPDGPELAAAASATVAASVFSPEQERRYRELRGVVCDEEALLRPDAGLPGP